MPHKFHLYSFTANSTATTNETLDDVIHDTEMLRNLNEKNLEVEKILSEKNLEVEKILTEKDAELLKMKKQLAEAEKQLRIQTQVSFYYFQGSIL